MIVILGTNTEILKLIRYFSHRYYIMLISLIKQDCNLKQTN